MQPVQQANPLPVHQPVVPLVRPNGMSKTQWKKLKRQQNQAVQAAIQQIAPPAAANFAPAQIVAVHVPLAQPAALPPAQGQANQAPAQAAGQPVAPPPAPAAANNGILATMATGENLVYSGLKKGVEIADAGGNILYNTSAFCTSTAGTLISPNTWSPLANNFGNVKKALKDQSTKIKGGKKSVGNAQQVQLPGAEIKDKRSPGKKWGQAVGQGVAAAVKVGFIADGLYKSETGRFSNTFNMYNHAVQNAPSRNDINGFCDGIADSIKKLPGAVEKLHTNITAKGNDICKSKIATVTKAFQTEPTREQISELDKTICGGTTSKYASGAVELIKGNFDERTIAIAGKIADGAGIAVSAYVFANEYTKLHEAVVAPATTLSEKIGKGAAIVGRGVTTTLSGASTIAGARGGVAGQLELGQSVVNVVNSTATLLWQGLPTKEAVVNVANSTATLLWESLPTKATLKEAGDSLLNGAGVLKDGATVLAYGLKDGATVLVKPLAEHPTLSATIAGAGVTIGLAAKTRSVWNQGERLKAFGWGLATATASAATTSFAYYNVMTGSQTSDSSSTS